MESEDLKIGGVKPDLSHNDQVKKVVNEDEPEFMLDGGGEGAAILDEVKAIKQFSGEEVIYGVYDNSEMGMFVKLNDFLIDHGKITLKDKSYFFHMLAVMVDAGIPVVQALKSLASRNKNQRFRRVLNTVAYSCENGSNLSESMSRFEDTFDEAEIGIVKSGEATGRLPSMLFKLSAQLDKTYDLHMKLWGAAVYPIAVLCVLILVMVGMLVWIFPTLLNLLSEGGIASENLPFATRLLMGLQTAVVDYWWAILGGAFVFYGIFNMYTRSSYGAVRYDYFKLKVPIVGDLIKRTNVLRFINSLGILIEAGLPVISVLKITGNSLKNRIYKLKIQEVIDHVKSGSKISQSLVDCEFLFPSEVVQMLNVGEQSASLAKVSEKVSDQYQREIDNTLKKLSSVFEPAMILFVGLFVALLALAIMAPIFNLTSIAGA